jgi:hypothetical protein
VTLDERLNAIPPRITSEDFLQGRGLGNEIAFFIFDYPPEQELVVRERIPSLITSSEARRPGIRIAHVNLLELVVEHLKERNLLDRAVELQRAKGDEHLLKALSAPLRPDRVAEVFARTARPAEHDVVLVSGVGSVYPFIRTHGLLNNLHDQMGRTPLVLFFPGSYNGQQLSIFGRLHDENYYRAFRLVP